MADQVERVVLEVDESPAVAGTKKANVGLGEFEKAAEKAGKSASNSFDSVGRTIVSVVDRTRTSIDRLVAQAEKRAATAGLDSIQKLAYERDQTLKKVAGNPAAIERTTAAYAKLFAQAKDGLVAQVESRAATAGLSSLQKLAYERDQTLKKVAGDPQAIQRVNAAYQKLIETSEHGSSKFKEFGETVARFFESPLSTAKELLVSVAEKMGPLGIAATATAGIISAVGFAAFESAKSLGEWGVQMNDLQLRTGLTAKEVGQFSFAAKAAGADASIFERIMRGLTLSLTDNSEASDKARDTLKKLGVEPRNLEGAIRPTSELLLEISEGLNKLPNTYARNKAALDLFKKAGIEAIPVMMELSENVKRARELGIGPSQKDIDQAKELNRQVTEIETAWSALVRNVVKKPLVLVVKAVADTSTTSRIPGAFTESVLSYLFGSGSAQLPAPRTPSAPSPEDNPLYKQAASGLSGYLQGSLEGARAQADRLKRQYEDARNAATQAAEAGRLLPQVAEEHRQKVEETWRAYQRQSDVLKGLEKDESRRVATLEKIRDLVREGSGFLRIGPGTKSETIVTQAEIDALKSKRPPSLRKRGEYVPDPDRMTPGNFPNLPEGNQPRGVFVSPDSSRQARDGEIAAQEAFGAGLIAKQQEFDREHLSNIQMEAEYTARIVELRTGPGGEIHAAEEVWRIRQNALDEEFKLTGDIFRYREESLHNEYDMRLRIAEEERKQWEGIRSTSEGLFHTLFTDTKNFGSALKTTIRDAFLKPIEQGLSKMVADALNPIIYGQDGKGGIAGGLRGIFNPTGATPPFLPGSIGSGKKLDVHSKSDLPSHIGDMVLQGGAVPVVVVNMPGTGQPGSATSMLSKAAGFAGLSGLLGMGSSASGAPAGVVTSTINGVSTGPGTVYGASGGLGGTPPFLPGSGGSMGPLGNLKGALGNIGDIGKVFSQAHGGATGSLGGALLGGGVVLAVDGLRRGGWKGMIETGAGGAAIGFKFGGPLGAVIGGAIGLGVGALRWLFGGKKPEDQMREAVRSVYGVDIRENSILKQMVQIAQQGFGGDYRLAARSDQIRELVSLYAQNTGQHGPGSFQNLPTSFRQENGHVMQMAAGFDNATPEFYKSSFGQYGYGSGGGSEIIPDQATKAPVYVQVQLDGQATTKAWAGQWTNAVAANPQVVTSATNKELSANRSRGDTKRILLRPYAVRS